MKKGFSLIEVITAIGILGIGVLSLVAFFALSMRFTKTARYITAGTNLAQSCLENQLGQPYTSLSPGSGLRARVSSDPASPFYEFEQQINIGLIDSSLQASGSDLGLKKIECVIYWDENNHEKQINLSTIKTSQ